MHVRFLSISNFILFNEKSIGNLWDNIVDGIVKYIESYKLVMFITNYLFSQGWLTKTSEKAHSTHMQLKENVERK